MIARMLLLSLVISAAGIACGQARFPERIRNAVAGVANSTVAQKYDMQEGNMSKGEMQEDKIREGR